LITRGCAAAAVLVMCGVGTVAAKSYKDGVIEIGENGYTITRRQEDVEQVKIQRSRMDVPEVAAFLKMGGVFPIEEDIPEVQYIDDVKSYDSIEAFREAEHMVAVIPDKTLFEETFTYENVRVIDQGRQVLVQFYGDDVYFSLRQSDNRDCESYSSNTSYGGQCVNRRDFTSAQGIGYVMFDSMDETGEVFAVHAVLSLNGWDLSISFEGFENEIIERVLNSLDLSVYF
jgi:hypothetical protein